MVMGSNKDIKLTAVSEMQQKFYDNYHASRGGKCSGCALLRYVHGMHCISYDFPFLLCLTDDICAHKLLPTDTFIMLTKVLCQYWTLVLGSAESLVHFLALTMKLRGWNYQKDHSMSFVRT